MDKFLIIGSNSFSGSSFINYILNKKVKILGVSRSKQKERLFASYRNNPIYKKKFSFEKLNINTKTGLDKLNKIINSFKPNIVVNYAAQGMVEQSWLHPEDWYNTNIIGQTKVYKILNKKFINRIIHVTTPEVYGNKNKKLNENSSFNPSTPYAISRMTLDIHLKKQFEYYNLPVIFTRTANVYGPTQDLYRIVPKSLLFSNLNRNFYLDGGGNSKRSFIFIDDASEAPYKICQRGTTGPTSHISTNKLVSIKNLVEKVYLKSGLNKKFIKYKKDRVGKDQIYNLSSEKLRKELNWSPKVSLEKGLNITEDWIKNNIKSLKSKKNFYKHKK